MNTETKTVAIIVAHPDDETLWSGGTILSNPSWQCFVASLCRKNDADRAPKFEKALKILGANGIMGDLDDGPDQIPLAENEVEQAILDLLPSTTFDLIITHNIYGEYTRHRRHEEIGKGVINLWHKGKLKTLELWTFAYEDGQRKYLPRAINNAAALFALRQDIWEQKYDIITKIYGFNTDSWEARATPKAEAFWQFLNVRQAYQWLRNADTIK